MSDEKAENGEKRWKGLIGLETQPMDEQQSEIFLTLCVVEEDCKRKQDYAGINDMESKMNDSFPPYQVLKKRLEACKKRVNPDMDVSVAVQMFCSSMCKTFGQAVMWAYTLNELSVDTNRPVDMTALAMGFPWGFPSAKEYDRAWVSQKVKSHDIFGTSNAVDNFDTWAKRKT